MNEFEIIQQYFASHNGQVSRSDVVIGIGDDAAITEVAAGQQLVSTTDVLIAGVHFPEATDTADIGYKALAVNISDLAAMGADPAWFSLTLSMPNADPVWLEPFSRGLFAIADEFNMVLVGGDTVRGPLVIGVQAFGLVPNGEALLRSNAKVGDAIYVTGNVGDAAVATQSLQGKIKLEPMEQQQVLTKLNRPRPRVAAGKVLRGVANSCIDLSDGLAADLNHILEASGVGATINIDSIPVSTVYKKHIEQLGGLARAMSFGDDYELCFTLPANIDGSSLTKLDLQVAYARVGTIEAEPGLRINDSNGQEIKLNQRGYNHFHEVSNY